MAQQGSTFDFLNDFYDTTVSETLTTESVIDCVMRSYLSKKSEKENLVFDKLRVGHKEDTKHQIIFIEEIPEGVNCEEHQNEEWVFGKCPAFSKTFYSPKGDEVEVQVKNGIVESVEGMRDDLVGTRYNATEIQSMIEHFNPGGDRDLNY